MKKIVYLSLSLVLSAVLLLSCNKNTPKDVAETWLAGFNHMDFEQAMKVSTNDTKNMLSSLKELTDMVNDSAKKDLKKVKVKVKDVKVDGDNAVATYTTSDNPRDQTLKLVKQNDKWLVQFTKTDLVGDVSGNADENAPVSEGTSPGGDTTHITVPAPAAQ